MRCTTLSRCVTLSGQPAGNAVLAGNSRDPPEKQAPMCTLRSFPHNISHCLTFARSEFEGLLEKGPAEVNAFLSDPAKYLAAIRKVSTCWGLACWHAVLLFGLTPSARA